MISNKAMTDDKMAEIKTLWSSIGKLHDGNFVQIILWENYLEKNLKIYWTTHNTLLQKTRCFGECSIVSLAQCGRAPVKLSLSMVQEGRGFESCMRLRKPTVSLWSFPNENYVQRRRRRLEVEHLPYFFIMHCFTTFFATCSLIRSISCPPPEVAFTNKMYSTPLFESISW